ncbi:MAG: hypothetical protein NT171_03400 [Planctomycetota bacterium]|nr:hypothetical protein [Planctomycetota bacterium]
MRRMNLRERRCRLPGHLVEEGHRIGIVPLDEEAAGRVAVPAVGIPEERDKLTDRRLRKSWRCLSRDRRGTIRCMLRHGDKPPQSAGVAATREIEVLLDRWGEARRMLDHLALHVDDPQGTVGPVSELHRAKPHVGRGDKLAFLVDPLGTDAGAVREELFPMDEIRANVADDEHPGQIADGIAADNRDPGGAGEVASRSPSPLDHPWHDPTGPESRPQHAPRFDRARAVNGGLRPLDGNAFLGRRRREEGIARKRTIIDHHPNRMVAVVAEVDVAEIVGRAAMLGAAGLGAEIVRARIEGKVAAVDRDRVADRLAVFADPPDLTAGGTASAVDPAVDVERERIEQPLDVPRPKPGEDLLVFVGDAITVAVFQPEDVGGIADKQAAAEDNQRRRPGEAVGIDRRPVIRSIGVVVVEEADPPQSLPLILAVASHLRDEQAAILVPGDRHGAGKQRLGDGQIDRETGAHNHRRRSVGGGRLRDAGELVGIVNGACGCLIGTDHDRTRRQRDRHDSPPHRLTTCPIHFATSSRVPIAFRSGASASGPTNELVGRTS